MNTLSVVSVLTSWSFEPAVILGLALAASLYALGWLRMGRASPDISILPSWRAWCFGFGLAAVGLALLSPIGVFSELLFFLHMTQHLLLMEVAAPLLLLGAPLLPFLWALPRALRTRIGRWFVPTRPAGRVFALLTHPLLAVSIYFTVIAVWHLPAFFDAAEGRTLVHDTEHLMFLGSALLYWWPVIHPTGGKRRLSYLAAIPYMLPPLLEGTLIGALLTLSDKPLYHTYLEVPRLWGISVVQDQQIAGLIMWVPGGLAYLAPILVLIGLLLRQEEVVSPT